MSDVTITLEQLRSHWQGHRALTRRTIEAFPDEHLFTYDVGGMRPFGKLVGEMLRMAMIDRYGEAALAAHLGSLK